MKFSFLTSATSGAQFVALSDLVGSDIEPAHPVGFVRACPERGIVPPEPAHLVACPPVVNVCLNRSRSGTRAVCKFANLSWRSFRFCTLLYCLQKFVESLGKQADPVVGEFVGDFLHGNPEFGQRSPWSVGRHRRLRSGWRADSRGRGRRPGWQAEWCSPCPARSALPRTAHRGRPDSWCWCWPTARVASARPWRPAPSSERCRNRLVFLVSLFAVGDRNFPLHVLQLLLLVASLEVLSLASIMESTSESMRLMKKLATLAIWPTSPPAWRTAPGRRCRLPPPSRKHPARRAG